MPNLPSMASLSPDAAAKLRAILREDGLRAARAETKLSKDALYAAAAEMKCTVGVRNVLEQFVAAVNR